MNTTWKKYFTYTYGLWVLAILFILLVVILFYFNRLAADDFYFLSLQNERGTIEGVKHCYESYSGRWLAYALTCFLLQFSNSSFFLIAFGCANFLLLLFAINALLGKALKFFKLVVTSSSTSLYSILFLATFFFCSFDKGETWFWFTSVCSYLVSITALLLLLNESLSSRFNGWTLFVLLLLAAYIGAASESYALLSILFFSGLLFIRLRKSSAIKDNTVQLSALKLILIVLFLCGSFFITAMAPGNAVRISLLPPQGSAIQFIAPIKAVAQLGLYFLKSQFILLLLICAPWYFWAVELKKNSKVPLPKIKIKSISLCFLFLLIVFVLILPATLLLSETPPARALSQLSLVISVVYCACFFYVGYFFPLPHSSLRMLKRFSFLLCCGLLISSIQNQFTIGQKYARGWDQRMEFLLQQKLDSKSKIVYLNKLGDSGWLYPAEISGDSSHFTNQHLRKALSLPFELALKTDLTKKN